MASIFDDLISGWRCEEQSAVQLIDCYGDNHMTPINNPGTAAGKVGNGRTLVSGGAQWFEINDNASLSLGAGVSATWAFWYKPTTVNVTQHLFSKRASAFEYWIRLDGGSNRFEFMASDSGTIFDWDIVQATAFGAPTAGNWHFITARIDAVNEIIKIGVNGVYNSMSHTGGIFDGGSKVEIGAGAGNEYANGVFDHAFFWKRYISDADLATHYASGAGLPFNQWATAFPSGGGSRAGIRPPQQRVGAA